MVEHLVKISDFTTTPGLRYRDMGDKSGEEFRNDILHAAYGEAVKSGNKLTVDFDGTEGYGPSFLEEAFGGMVREYKIRNLLDNLIFITNEDLSVETQVTDYIKEENERTFK